MTSSNINIRKATEDDIAIIRNLANIIWSPTFAEILSAEQISYMLELIYSEHALKKQMHSGHHFLIAEDNNTPFAYADYSLLKNDVYKLHKIYVLPSQQGKNIGRLLIEYIIQTIKKENAASLLLNVNRHNKAKAMYEKIGFRVIGEEDIDIGEGYFMNDYVMEKKL